MSFYCFLYLYAFLKPIYVTIYLDLQLNGLLIKFELRVSLILTFDLRASFLWMLTSLLNYKSCFQKTRICARAWIEGKGWVGRGETRDEARNMLIKALKVIFCLLISVWLRNRLITTGLEPVLSSTEKSCLSYYIQFSDMLKQNRLPYVFCLFHGATEFAMLVFKNRLRRMLHKSKE